MTTQSPSLPVPDPAPAQRRGRIIAVDYALAGTAYACHCLPTGAGHAHTWRAVDVTTCAEAVHQLLAANPYARVLGIRELEA